MSLAVLGIALIALLAGPSVSAAATITWNNPAGGDWNTATNWSPPQVPGPNDVAAISLSGTYTVALDGNARVASFTLGGVGGTQTLTNGGYSLVIDGPSTITSHGVYVQTSGTLTGVGALTVHGTLDLAGGFLRGNGDTTIAGGGTLSISGNEIKYLERTVLNAGSVRWSGEGDLQGSSFPFTNQAGGRFSVENGRDWKSNPAGSRMQFFNELGATLTKRGKNSSTRFMAGSFHNDGTVDVQIGVLRLEGGGTCTGSLSVASRSAVHLSSYGSGFMLGAGATFTGAGTVTVGATLVVTASVSMENLELFGAIDGPGTLIVRGAMRWRFAGKMRGAGGLTLAPGASLVFEDHSPKDLARRLDNFGTVTWSDSDIRGGQGAVFANKSGGQVIIGNDLTWSSSLGGAPARFENEAGGILTKNGASGTTTFADVHVTNAGTVSAAAGTLDFAAGMLQTAGVTRLVGGDVRSEATFAVQGGMVEGTGTIIGNVVDGARLSPGTSPGAISVTGPYAQTATGSFAVELDGTTPGTEFDQLAVVGPVAVAGALDVGLGFAPADGTRFVIIHNDGGDAVQGTFAGLPEGATFAVGSTPLRVSYVGGNGNDVTLTVDRSVPVPVPTATGTATAVPATTPPPSATATATPVGSRCIGDCNDDGAVTIDELITGVNQVLELAPLDVCPQFDVTGDAVVTVNEIIAAVNASLDPCG